MNVYDGFGMENILEAICHKSDVAPPLEASVNFVLRFRQDGPTVKLALGDGEMTIDLFMVAMQPLSVVAVRVVL